MTDLFSSIPVNTAWDISETFAALKEPDPPYQAHSETSKEAATAIKVTAGSMRARVLDAIKVFGPVTDERLALELDMNPSTLRPRRHELALAGLIVADPTEGRTLSGRRAVRWVVA